MRTFHHILVPTDFGPAALAAQELALDLASGDATKITLLHVWSVPTYAYAEALSWPTDEIESSARTELTKELGALKARHANSEMVLLFGAPWESILATAKARGIDLIVMGTHGRRGLPRLILGSVAERVLRLSPIPVLTVPNADE